MKPLLVFEGDIFEDYVEWSHKDRKIFDRINDLIADIFRNYFKGLGKPEPLKYNFKGCWSRRITDEHRLVYRVEQGKIYIVSCKRHYE